MFRELQVGPLSKSLPNHIPAPRSGHRIFTDDEFLYVIGGFDRTPEDREGKIYREVWRYNLYTREWSQMNVHGNFPTALASFAVAQSAPFSNQVLLFGGTAVPFGATTSSTVHLLSFHSDSSTLVSTLLPVAGEKLATYGHTMLRGHDPNTFYVIGGTTGHIFFLDVDKLSYSNGKWTWSNEAQTTPNEEGRYRLETVLHGDLIYFFGGGRPDYVTELQNITVFNTVTKKFSEIPTYPDEDWIRPLEEEDGFPRGRR
ncbi:kelch repeat protein [Oesophagostomum dentatum]|uniref:Kelch domain-containing protein 10 n=1 Tax=Oesophagostomum dentatum TaxID=61180 RepID=A0A0B1SEJ3_OESDE|nr:kelch repeat protein [Oesophagostomum dentatum]